MERDGDVFKFTPEESAAYELPAELSVDRAIQVADACSSRAASLRDRSDLYINDPSHGRAFQGARMQQEAMDHMRFSKQIMSLCAPEIMERMLSDIPGIDTK